MLFLGCVMRDTRHGETRGEREKPRRFNECERLLLKRTLDGSDSDTKIFSDFAERALFPTTKKNWVYALTTEYRNVARLLSSGSMPRTFLFFISPAILLRT